MRKSTIFISAVLTTFALVMLYRVASAYNDSKLAAKAAAATSAPAATEAPADVSANVSADTAAPATTALGPVEAAQLAAKVVGHNDLLSAETSSFNGAAAYMVTFTNNDVVYVGLDGQILSVQVAPVTPVVVNVPVPAATKARKKDGAHSSSPSGGTYSGDDHEHDD